MLSTTCTKLRAICDHYIREDLREATNEIWGQINDPRSDLRASKFDQNFLGEHAFQIPIDSSAVWIHFNWPYQFQIACCKYLAYIYYWLADSNSKMTCIFSYKPFSVLFDTRSLINNTYRVQTPPP